MESKKRPMVTAVFRDRMDWENVYEWLRDRGYGTEEINVLMSDATHSLYKSDKDDARAYEDSHAAEGMAAGGAVGTAIGASLAALLAIGTTVFIPPLGLVIAGPIAAAFAGGGAGAVAGGVLGGLLGLGVPEASAKLYQQALREGGVVVGVIPRSHEDGKEIEEAFKTHHGENIVRC